MTIMKETNSTNEDEDISLKRAQKLQEVCSELQKKLHQLNNGEKSHNKENQCIDSLFMNNSINFQEDNDISIDILKDYGDSVDYDIMSKSVDMKNESTQTDIITSETVEVIASIIKDKMVCHAKKLMKAQSAIEHLCQQNEKLKRYAVLLKEKCDSLESNKKITIKQEPVDDMPTWKNISPIERPVMPTPTPSPVLQTPASVIATPRYSPPNRFVTSRYVPPRLPSMNQNNFFRPPYTSIPMPDNPFHRQFSPMLPFEQRHPFGYPHPDYSEFIGRLPSPQPQPQSRHIPRPPFGVSDTFNASNNIPMKVLGRTGYGVINENPASNNIPMKVLGRTGIEVINENAASNNIPMKVLGRTSYEVINENAASNNIPMKVLGRTGYEVINENAASNNNPMNVLGRTGYEVINENSEDKENTSNQNGFSQKRNTTLTISPQPKKQCRNPSSSTIPFFLPRIKANITASMNSTVLQWDYEQNVDDVSRNAAISYHLFAYQVRWLGEIPPMDLMLWKKIGVVDALPLPMACTLTQFDTGKCYFFTVLPVDVIGRFGEKSNPCVFQLQGTR